MLSVAVREWLKDGDSSCVDDVETVAVADAVTDVVCVAVALLG